MFTYDEYLDLINIGTQQNCTFFLRHDIDISPQKAVQMAEIESTAQLKSTYYILTSSPFYNAFDKENIQRFKMIKQMGHGIGLHFDASIKPGSDKDVADEIVVLTALLEHYIGPLTGMSMTVHKPVMGGGVSDSVYKLLNKVQIYCPNYDEKFKYISDSGHNWREDPVEAVLSNKFIQINTHPEWYNDEEKTMEDCLHSLALDKATDRLINKRIVEIREYLEKIK